MDRWLQRMQAHWNRYGRTYAYKHGNTVQLRLMVCKLDEEDLKELLNTYGGERYVRCWRAASDAAMEYLYDMRDGMSEVRLMEFAVYVDFWQLLHVSKRGRGYRVDGEWTSLKKQRRDELLVLLKGVQERIEHMKMFDRAALTEPAQRVASPEP